VQHDRRGHDHLDREARRLEAVAEGGQSFEEILAAERRNSHRYRGMTVFGPARPPSEKRPARRARPHPDQLTLDMD